MTCKDLRLFFNILTADDKYPLLSRDNLMQEIQMLLSENQKGFSQSLYAFFKSTSNFEHFQKKITFIACIFAKLQTPKDVVR